MTDQIRRKEGEKNSKQTKIIYNILARSKSPEETTWPVSLKMSDTDLPSNHDTKVVLSEVSVGFVFLSTMAARYQTKQSECTLVRSFHEKAKIWKWN